MRLPGAMTSLEFMKHAADESNAPSGQR